MVSKIPTRTATIETTIRYPKNITPPSVARHTKLHGTDGNEAHFWQQGIPQQICPVHQADDALERQYAHRRLMTPFLHQCAKGYKAQGQQAKRISATEMCDAATQDKQNQPGQSENPVAAASRKGFILSDKSQ